VIKYKAKKITESHYEFRGNAVHRDVKIKEGVLGAWYTTGGARLEMVATSLEDMMTKIAGRLDH